MKRTASLFALIAMLAGCDQLNAAKEAQQKQQVAPEAPARHFNVALSCVGPGGFLPVAYCFFGNSGQIGGSLKIRSGDDVKMYSPNQIAVNFTGDMIHMDLKPTFEVIAQPNSDENLTLHLEIRDGRKPVYRDVSSALVPVAVTNDLID